MDQNENTNIMPDFATKGKMHDVITLTDKGSKTQLYQLIRVPTKDEPTMSLTEMCMKGMLEDVLSEIIQPEHMSMNVDHAPGSLSYCHIQYEHAINEEREFEKTQLAATLTHDDTLYELFVIVPAATTAEDSEYGVHYRHIVRTLTLPDKHITKETYESLYKSSMWAGSLSNIVDVYKMTRNLDNLDCALYVSIPPAKDWDLLPEDLRRVMELAVRHNCSKICFTEKDDYIDGLPVYLR